jgi:DNA modification methylase
MLNLSGYYNEIPLTSIISEERSREVLGNIDELLESIRTSGLINPLTVKDNKDGTFKLLAGGRRLAALHLNNDKSAKDDKYKPITEIKCHVYDRDLSELEMKVIEKSENFFRKDMEFWEMDKLTLDIHKMQQELHGVSRPGPGNEGWSVEDTGKLLGGAPKSAISLAIKRAEIREMCPEIFDGCKTASDATAIVKKMDEAIVRECIAKQLENNNTDAVTKQLANSYIIKDFFIGVKDIPDGVFHLVEIDPPYAIDLQNAKKTEGVSQYTMTDYNEIPSDDYREFICRVFKECYRVMTEHSWLLCWFAPEPWFEIIYSGIKSAGFETTRMCPIWTKPGGQTKRPEMHLPNSYEMFFYAWKGRPAIAKARSKNVFDNHPPIPPQQKTHPTERPISLMQDMYETFAFPGSRILIPFLGSGNGIISAHKAGMSAMGFDLGKSFKDSYLVKVHNLK